MKKIDLYIIQPIDYASALSALKESNINAKARQAILKIISDHKILIEIQEKLIHEQYKLAGGLFAFNNTDAEIEAAEEQAGDNSNTASAYESRQDDVNTEESDSDEAEESNNDANSSGNNSDAKPESEVKRRNLPTGVITRHKLKESEKECENCGKRMHMCRTKTKTIIVSRPLLSTETHETESCRCLACNNTKDAATPAILEEIIGRYHYSAVAPIVALRYQYGMASFRLEAFSANIGIKIPDSTQWLLFEEAASRVKSFVTFLEKIAANAPTQQTDDTSAMVLEIARKIEEKQIEAINNGKKPDSVRSGIHTTNVTSVFPEGKIVLFRTGLHHAGEIIAKILGSRTAEEEVVIMTDAASSNASKLDTIKAKTILANCNSHSIRKFIELMEAEKEIAKQYGVQNPIPNSDLDFIVTEYKKIFDNDDVTKAMTPEQRLEFHKQNSMPIMESILKKIENDFLLKLVEPNSDLGGVYTYFKKHFPELTEFCKSLNAPVCNNLSERMLKCFIRYRKNSLFFKNQLGAKVGDIFTTILFTADANGINSVEYLTNLLKYKKHWSEHLEEWLPWNYPATISKLLAQAQ